MRTKFFTLIAAVLVSVIFASASIARDRYNPYHYRNTAEVISVRTVYHPMSGNVYCREERVYDRGRVAAGAAAGAIIGRNVSRRDRDFNTVAGAVIGGSLGSHGYRRICYDSPERYNVYYEVTYRQGRHIGHIHTYEFYRPGDRINLHAW